MENKETDFWKEVDDKGCETYYQKVNGETVRVFSKDRFGSRRWYHKTNNVAYAVHRNKDKVWSDEEGKVIRFEYNSEIICLKGAERISEEEFDSLFEKTAEGFYIKRKPGRTFITEKEFRKATKK